VVIFDPFIEPILDDTCVEMSPGEVVCDPLWVVKSTFPDSVPKPTRGLYNNDA